jgi:glycosyltransferase involved in cell wall biosynthesis
MPIYNVEEYIYESIMSILDQTFSDFEFIIIDDGSYDRTSEIVNRIKDSRIRFIQRTHMGTVYQLNCGLSEAMGEYIARQDSDDRSHRERFARQVHFLDTHLEYGVVSTAMQLIDGKSEPMEILRYPEEPDFEKLMEKCCISHPAAMWRREINERIGGYDEAFNKNCCEDYDFWLRVVEDYRLYVLNEVLYTKREHPNSSISRTRGTYVPTYDDLARQKARARKLKRNMIQN